MPQLFLNFTDENGFGQRVAVDRPKFVIGRHSGCDLPISDSRLSRRHAQIESFGAVFVVSDLGSSNGTKVRETHLTEPAAIADGDLLDLGGFPVRVEIIADETRPRRAQTVKPSNDAVSAPAPAASSIPTAVFIIAPLLAVVFLICGGGVLWFTAKDNPTTVVVDPTETQFDDDTPTPKPSPVSSSSPGSSASPTPGASTDPTPVQNDDKKELSSAAAAFLQQIALNDPSAFLQGSELDLVTPKINSLKGSSALADNLKAVRASAGEFKTLAETRGLKPQFLAAAALAQLGSSRGNPLETAKSMAPVFADLRVTLANNLADDNLMMVAAFDQGRAGRPKDLRNQLEALAKKNPSVSPREIRTIWFLKKQGKLSDAEFDFALRFIAVGTIAQNPKLFGVNAEKLAF